MSSQIADYLQTTGRNNAFVDGGKPFADYILNMQTLISDCHIHQPQYAPATIIEANKPFDWPLDKAKRGIVLIHGLTDSPFQMQDLALFFKQQGFWVRAIILPGHGTVPGDLLHVKLDAWQQTLAYAVADLAKQVEEVYLAGYSAGGALALEHALNNDTIRGLVLLAPALRLKRYIEIAVRTQMWLKTLWQRAHWLSIEAENDYAKYASLPVNGVFQLQLLSDSLQTLETSLGIPIFTVLSATDEIINPQPVISLHQASNHPANRLLIYAKEPTHKGKGIIHKTSYYPEQNILNFSHIGLATSPANHHYGEKGDYQPFLACQGDPKATQIYKGALRLKAPKDYKLQRLSYNPDFAGMLEILADWLQACR